MSDIIDFDQQSSEHFDDYFGVCPTCGRHDGYMNVGREHWFHCKTHKTKWNFGSNVFSCWRDQADDEWRENEFQLSNYKTVTGLPTEAA